MKIAIDISPIVYETGVSVYTRCLVKKLLEIDGKNQYILFGTFFRRKKDAQKILESFKGNFTFKSIPIPPTMAPFFWNQLRFPSLEAVIGEVDVFHSSDWTQPKSRAFKVTTVHDLSPILFSGDAPGVIAQVHKKRLAVVKGEVNRIIVPSRATKDALLSLGFISGRVKVIAEALDERIKKSSELEVSRVKEKYGVGEYFLAVGANERKNTRRIIEAFRRVRGENFKLVVVGQDWLQMESSPEVIFTGHVSRNDLSALYTGSAALLYPSLDEGFGLPILEAFYLGTPVVTSNLSSMPEVAGNAAVLVNPKSVDSISDGILQALKGRKMLIEKGSERVEEFSWDKAARETLEVYTEGVKNL